MFDLTERLIFKYCTLNAFTHVRLEHSAVFYLVTVSNYQARRYVVVSVEAQ